MKRNPFKKQSITDTLVNVGVGGAANVAFDYLVGMIDPDGQTMDDTTRNIVKVAAGALLGSMAGNRYLHAATDGIAVVGVSNLLGGLVADTANTSSSSSEASSGLPRGTIGRVRMGDPYFKKSGKKNGFVAGSLFGK